MHELSVAESLMNIVLEQAKANDARNVKKISVVVGNQAGVVVDSLKYCFDAVKQGTVANDAELAIEEVTAMAHCPDCNDNFPAGPYDFACPRCGGIVFPTGGKELYVKEMEVE